MAGVFLPCQYLRSRNSHTPSSLSRSQHSMTSPLTGKRTERPSPDPLDDKPLAKKAKPLAPSQSFADVLKEMPVNETVLDRRGNAINGDEDLVFQYVDMQLHHFNWDVALVFGVTEEGVRVLVHLNGLSGLPQSETCGPLQTFMLFNEITAMSWMEIPASRFRAVDAFEMLSHNQVEVAVKHGDIIFHPPEGPWTKSAPLRILSFDIQSMVSPGNRMPRYEHEPVLQIGNMLSVKDASVPYSRCIFTLDTCSDIAGADIRSYETEKDMLLAWRAYVVEADPDVIVGHDIACLDIPQLLLRAWTLELAEFACLGRLKDVYAEAFMQPVNYRKVKDAPILAGRLQLDTRQYMAESTIRRTNLTTTKRPKCDLTTVAFEFLSKTKEDIPSARIEGLQLAGPDERRKLAVYCLKETHLPLEIFHCPKLRCFDEAVEAARSSEKYMYRPFREFLRNGRNKS
ncbi:ribonuclease H-like domain-containing protein [Mycena rosella]|uniref:DNA polymerase delta catalytic subunit n=1 Tax=Mycena rosella TaxID=1033263 RepID=A0AAD7DXP4_MYCRO|nr:ribonuclease H-like domain-containing protein [Mycena rosella]